MKFVIRRARRGLLKRSQWTFRIVADNGETIAAGETYNNRLDCKRAVALIMREAATAEVEDL